MVVTILGEGRGRVAMLVQLYAPAVGFDLVQPLLTPRWGRLQNWNGGSDVAHGERARDET